MIALLLLSAAPIHLPGGQQGQSPVLLFSPDGKRLVAAYPGNRFVDGRLVVWDAKTWAVNDGAPAGVRQRQPDLEFRDGLLHWRPGSRESLVRDVGKKRFVAAYRPPDGRRFSHLSRDGKTRLVMKDAGSFEVLDEATGKVRRTVEDAGALKGISPDGKFGLSARIAEDTVLHVWDLTTGKKTASVRTGEFAPAAALSPDNKTVAVCRVGPMRLYDLATGKMSGELPMHHPLRFAMPAPDSLAWSPDGKRLAAGEATGDIAVYDVPGKKLEMLLTPNPRPVGQWLSRDGKRAMFQKTGATSGARVFDIATSRHVRDVEVKGDGRFALAPDGETVYHAGRDSGTVTRFGAGEPTRWVGMKGTSALAVSPDGKTLAQGGPKGALRLCDAKTGKEPASLTLGTAEVTHLEWDGPELRAWAGETFVIADGKAVRKPLTREATHPSGRFVAARVEGRIEVREKESKRVLLRMDEQAKEGALAFLPDGRLAAATDYEGLAIHDLGLGNFLGAVVLDEVKDERVALGDQHAAIFGLYGQKVAIWDLRTGKVEAYPTKGIHAGGFSMSLGKAWEGTRFFFVDLKEEKLVALDAATAKRQWAAPLERGSNAHRIRFAAGGSAVLVSSRRRFTVLKEELTAASFNALTGKPIRAGAAGASFTRDRGLMATPVAGGVEVRKSFTDKLVYTFKSASPVVETCFCPDGSFLALACEDGTVQMQSLSDGMRYDVKMTKRDMPSTRPVGLSVSINGELVGVEGMLYAPFSGEKKPKKARPVGGPIQPDLEFVGRSKFATTRAHEAVWNPEGGWRHLMTPPVADRFTDRVLEDGRILRTGRGAEAWDVDSDEAHTVAGSGCGRLLGVGEWHAAFRLGRVVTVWSLPAAPVRGR